MSWSDLAQLLTAFAALIAAGVSVWNAVKIEQVHIATNSMKDALVKSTGEQAYAKGVKDEKERTAT